MTKDPNREGQAAIVQILRITLEKVSELNARVESQTERIRTVMDDVRGSLDAPPTADPSPHHDSLGGEVEASLGKLSVRVDLLETEVDRL